MSDAASSSSDFELQLNEACDSLTAAWRADDAAVDNVTRLEDLLQRFPASTKSLALERLLRIELNLRRGRSESPLVEEYERRFPQQLNAVRRVFAVTARSDADTIAHTPSRFGSGLQIQCPHCSNHVELVADTPYAEITCRSCGSTFNLVDRQEHTRDAEALKRVGRFELLSRLGMGGFGTVWKARDAELDRAVAVKIPRKGQLGLEEIEQFFREARATAQLRHPNIVSIHEVGREGDTIFIVGELVRGVELSDWLTGESPSFRLSASMCRTIALALHYAHEQGIVHRDLKPSNIMLDESGEPRLMDFGLAKREVGEITMTVDGQILGTPAYMSPEQAAGRSHWTDRRTDIYSLGVVFFRLLTSELPFRGNAQMQIYQRLKEDPPNPRQLNRHVPRDLATICLKCLERDPNRRYATAKEVANELGRYLEGMPIKARPINSLERTIRWSKRNPAWATAAALTCVLAIAGPLAAWRINRQRVRLANLIVEKDNLIARNGEDQKRQLEQISRLQADLDLWEGRANPWEFWPPEPLTPPLVVALGAVHDQHYAQAIAALDSADHDEIELAKGRVALAYLADATGRHAAAITQFKFALNILRRLSTNDAANLQLAAALADCHAQLARLLEDDAEAAKQHLEEAVRLYAKLTAADENGLAYLVDRVDLTLRQAVDLGREAGAQQLQAAAALTKQLQRDWPSEPAAMYALVCRLVGRAPLLENASTIDDQK